MYTNNLNSLIFDNVEYIIVNNNDSNIIEYVANYLSIKSENLFNNDYTQYKLNNYFYEITFSTEGSSIKYNLSNKTLDKIFLFSIVSTKIQK